MIPLRGGETGEMYTKVIGGNKNGLRNKCERDRHSKGTYRLWHIVRALDATGLG